MTFRVAHHTQQQTNNQTPTPDVKFLCTTEREYKRCGACRANILRDMLSYQDSGLQALCETLSCLFALRRQHRMGLQPHIVASRDTLTADTLTTDVMSLLEFIGRQLA